MADAEYDEEYDEYEEDYYEEGDEDDDEEAIPDHIVSLKVVKGKRMVEVMFKGAKTSSWFPEDQFLYPGMVKRFEAEHKKNAADEDHKKDWRGTRGGRGGGRGGASLPSRPQTAAEKKAEDEKLKKREQEKVKPWVGTLGEGGAPPSMTYGRAFKTNETLVFPSLLPPKELAFEYQPFADLSPPYDPFASVQLDAAVQATLPVKPQPRSAEDVATAVHQMIDKLPSSVDLTAWADSVADDHVRELAWTCHTLTTISLHGCRGISKKSLKALGDAPNLTSVDLSGARVTISGFVLLCSKGARRLREINLNRMHYHRIEPEPAPGNIVSEGCSPFVQAALRLCAQLRILRCVDAHPVLPIEKLAPELHFMGTSPKALDLLTVLHLDDHHTQWSSTLSFLAGFHMSNLTDLRVSGPSRAYLRTLTRFEYDSVVLLAERAIGRTQYPPVRTELVLNDPLMVSTPWRIRHLELHNLCHDTRLSVVIGTLWGTAPLVISFKLSYARQTNGYLIAAGDNIKQAPPFPHLKLLSLENTPWVDDTLIQDLLPRAPQLQTLGLVSSTANISGPVLGSLAKYAPQLRALAITLNDESAAKLGTPPLVSLRLGRSELSAAALGALLQKYSASLLQLDLHQTPFTLTVDGKQVLAAVATNCPALQELRVYHCGFRWETPEKIELASLRAVRTCGCTVAHSGAAMLAWRAKKNVVMQTERCVWEHW